MSWDHLLFYFYVSVVVTGACIILFLKWQMVKFKNLILKYGSTEIFYINEMQDPSGSLPFHVPRGYWRCKSYEREVQPEIRELAHKIQKTRLIGYILVPLVFALYIVLYMLGNKAIPHV